MADAGPDQPSVTQDSPVTLDGPASTDPEGGSLAYSWVQTFGPAVTLVGANTANPSFIAPDPATLVFQLTVSDGTTTDTDTVTITVTRAAATLLIAEHLKTRGTLMIASQPDIQRRIDRLNGISTGSTTVSDLMSMFSSAADGGSASFHASLAGYAGRDGNVREDTRFDVWMEARFARTNGDTIDGSFAMGSLGADYLVTPNLLAGAFVSVDRLTMDAATGPAEISGTAGRRVANWQLWGRIQPVRIQIEE